MSNIIKAPDVMADNQGASEINQDNDNTKPELMPATVLSELVRIQKEWVAIKSENKYKIIAVNYEGIHLTAEAFLAAFEHYTIRKRIHDSVYSEELIAYHDDVKFYCIR